MVICCCVGTFTSFIWLFGDTNDFPRISRYTFHPISYLPNIHLKHGLISVCFVCFSFHFKKKTYRKPKNPLTHTLVWTNTQCPVSKGFTSAAAAAASALYRQSPANTIRLIWQAKENQTASQYTKEVRAAGALNREALHSLWPSFTAQGGLDRGGGGGGYLGNNRYTYKASLYWTLCLDKIVVPPSWAVFNLQDITAVPSHDWITSVFLSHKYKATGFFFIEVKCLLFFVFIADW